MSTQTPLEPPVFGKPPFDSPSAADIILHTSDNVVLFTYKLDLMRASAFFDNLLSDGVPDGLFEGHPMIPVPEPSPTMHFVLRLCSPGYIMAEDIMRVEHVSIISALDKYLMDAPRRLFITLIKENAPSIVERNPLRAFALARAVGLQDISSRAARASLCKPISAWPQDTVRFMSGTDYHCLVSYHQRCGDAAKRAANVALKPPSFTFTLTPASIAPSSSPPVAISKKMPACLCIKPGSPTTALVSGTPRLSAVYLTIGSSYAFHIRRTEQDPSNVLSFQSILDMDKMLHIGDYYHEQPGQTDVSPHVFDLVWSSAYTVCGADRDPKETRRIVRKAFDEMQKEIEVAVGKVPLEMVSGA
ncbi:hypothetical protein CYLTODRAFT_420091 [Cylindrobasidium torrendii FP15055 ss-10]|uniref:BTB domain-containing protein n=1 Tax=Cylindrobasidium torrendii FP15055 ss-10 TaxID=1314674 RepID=A0A0D7BJ45_9AGAR|nr:hypothetical protein CYLTODRAFT_420091 [Cylindrobasidium torrendii FP15055 ss-10]